MNLQTGDRMGSESPRLPRKHQPRKRATRQTEGVSLSFPTGYAELLDVLKARIRASQVRAVLAANREIIQLYWDIGKAIVERQRTEGWGAAVVDRLARDLQTEFPGMPGFSPSNISRMRAFYSAYIGESGISAQAVPKSRRRNSAQPVPEMGGASPPVPVAEIPWGHNVVLLFKLKDSVQRLWYARKTVENGWSRAVLVHQIESSLYARQGAAITNFERTLPPPQSDLARQVLKDPYVFDFLALRQDVTERDIECALADHIQRFLLELGVGFAFVGRQYPLEVGGEDFYLDLLFYHLRLRCFVVVDLKVCEFTPEHAGKMNFYLSAVDDVLRCQDDAPSLGLILCKSKNRIVVEYALRDFRKPIGVASYELQLVESLPRELRGKLPTAKQIEAELNAVSRQSQ